MNVHEKKARWQELQPWLTKSPDTPNIIHVADKIKHKDDFLRTDSHNISTPPYSISTMVGLSPRPADTAYGQLIYARVQLNKGLIPPCSREGLNSS